MTARVLLSMRVSLMSIGGLDGLRRRSRILWLLYGVLPVVESVLEEDHVAVLFAGGTAFLDNVPQRRSRLEEPELRLEIGLTILRGLHRPEGVCAVHEHLMWQGVDAALPDLQLPVGWRTEREVDPEIPVLGVLSKDPG